MSWLAEKWALYRAESHATALEQRDDELQKQIRKMERRQQSVAERAAAISRLNLKPDRTRSSQSRAIETVRLQQLEASQHRLQQLTVSAHRQVETLRLKPLLREHAVVVAPTPDMTLVLDGFSDALTASGQQQKELAAKLDGGLEQARTPEEQLIYDAEQTMDETEELVGIADVLNASRVSAVETTPSVPVQQRKR